LLFPIAFLESGGLGEGEHVVGGAGKFQDAVGDPFFEGLFLVPGAFVGVRIGMVLPHTDKSAMLPAVIGCLSMAK
jgi:hypothetical protein